MFPTTVIAIIVTTIKETTITIIEVIITLISEAQEETKEKCSYRHHLQLLH